jgi:hypothetical protein
MPTGTHTETLVIEGRLMQRVVDKTADNAGLYGGASAPITLAAGQAASAWVKTDADTAACSLTAGHGYTTGVADVYWTAGRRYGVTMTVSTDDLTLDGGTGDDFPESAAEDVIVTQQQQVNVTIDGDLAALVGVTATVRGHVDFQDSAGNSICPIDLVADTPDLWDSDMSTTPYTGAIITKAMVSNGTAAAGTLEIIVLQDSTP